METAEKESKITVIVPVYGVEDYIAGCIESLCKQTWRNLEILLVDDGSKDRSGEICDAWAKKDGRIRVLHLQNGGQSFARNAGLSEATGDYIGFVDGDDRAQPQMYETLLCRMLETGADIAECNFTGRKSPEPDRMPKGECLKMDGREAIARQLDLRISSRYPSTSLWSKLFKAELIRDLRLPEGRIHEEYGFLCQAFCRCRTYVYLNENLYQRTLRQDSTTAAAFSERTLDKLEVFRQRSAFLRECREGRLYTLSKEQEYELMLHYYGQARLAGLSSTAKQLEREMRAEQNAIQKSGLPGRRKMQYRLFFQAPSLYEALLHFRNRRGRRA